MADAKLTALTAASALAGADLFYISQGGVSKKATHTQLLTLVGTTYVPLAGGTMTGALTIASGNLVVTEGAITGGYAVGTPTTPLLTLKNGGATKFEVDYAGYFTATGFVCGVHVAANYYATGLRFSSTSQISWTSTANANGTADLFLYRDAAATLAQRNGTNAQTLRIYGTADGSPGSNYQRMVLSANGTTGVTIAAEGLGAPGTNQSITLTPGGAGDVNFPSAARVNTSGYFFGTGALYTASSINYYASGVRSNSAAEYAWTSGVVGGSVDTALFRNAAGIVEVTNGTAGTWRDLKLRNLLNVEYHQMTEMTAPSAPATNSVRIYAEDNGAGKTRLMALFATGAAQQISIEP